MPWLNLPQPCTFSAEHPGHGVHPVLHRPLHQEHVAQGDGALRPREVAAGNVLTQTTQPIWLIHATYHFTTPGRRDRRDHRTHARRLQQVHRARGVNLE